MNSNILKKAAESFAANNLSWMVTVINTSGSTPTRVGMKMLVSLTELLDGTIGGGAIEKEVIDKIRTDKPKETVKWSFDLAATGMICGGVEEVLIEPLFNHAKLYIIGGGHCGKALCELAARCDFNVSIIDDRDNIVTRENHPLAAELICAPYKDIEQHINFSPEIFIVTMTHGHKHDQIVMEKVLDKEYKYFGVIGSKTKVKSCFTRLLNKGFSKEQLEKIYAPIGFAIGSQAPMEVAISILAQLIAVKNGIM